MKDEAERKLLEQRFRGKKDACYDFRRRLAIHVSSPGAVSWRGPTDSADSPWDSHGENSDYMGCHPKQNLSDILLHALSACSMKMRVSCGLAPNLLSLYSLEI